MKKKLVNSILIGVGAFFLLLFVFSGFLAIRQENTKTVTGETIADYASGFIDNNNLIEIGKETSCSEFTSLVYRKFGIELPEIAGEQYKMVQLTDSFLVGNLVFFAIYSSHINHVGLILNDTIFVHSPGVNKSVCTQNIKAPYWFNTIIGTGKLVN